MRAPFYTVCLFASLIPAAAGPAMRANGSSDCIEKRERCVESCGKQREACDRNASSEDQKDRCVKQQNQCESGCYDAWKKCEENSKPGDLLSVLTKELALSLRY